MVDLGVKGSEAVEANNRNPHGASSIDEQQQKKTCADCGTSKTPLWRSGPAGPKSLCNACGIRSRKKRRATLSVNKGINDDRKKRKRSCSGSSNGDSLKQRLLALMNEVLTQRPPVERHWKKLGEEEQAAVLLMSLSA